MCNLSPIPMVALAKSQIPNDVASLEELLAWAASALFEAHGADRVLEIEGIAAVPACEYTLINAPGGDLRLVTRVSLPVAKAILTDTSKKPWKHITPFAGNLALPTGYAQA